MNGALTTFNYRLKITKLKILFVCTGLTKKRKIVSSKKKETLKVSKLIPTPTGSAEKSTSNSSFSSSSSSESDSDTDYDVSDSGLREDSIGIVDSVTVHDIVWKFGKNVHFDTYKDGKYGPVIQSLAADIANYKELNYWKLFFPTEKVGWILECINENLRDHRKAVTIKELYKVFGLLYAMTINTLPNRRDYWSTVEGGIFRAPNFGRFGMGVHRFEEILGALSFHKPTETDNDKWLPIRCFVNMLNEKWYSVIRPGYKLTVDESMFSWYGKGGYGNVGMPTVIKIKRKPKGVGCEVKNIADSTSNIMLRMEINEGKDLMKEKKWQAELGAGTATLLRLSEPWFYTGRIVVADSWFGSVKASENLLKNGLYFMGMVKTATRNFPIKELISRCPLDRGSYIHAIAKVGEIKSDFIAMAWRDKKVHTLVSSCGTTQQGSPAKKNRYDENGNRYIKTVNRPQLFETYFDGAPSIDIHNHIRQDGLGLEVAWGTQDWKSRMFACLFGIIETNAYLAFKYFGNFKNNSHVEFTQALALQLIHFDEQANPCSPPGSSTSDESETFSDHSLRALSSEDTRQRVQRKCIVCSKMRRTQQKASYYCVKCGKQAVLCSPQTGRNCFAYHIVNGFPF